MLKKHVQWIFWGESYLLVWQCIAKLHREGSGAQSALNLMKAAVSIPKYAPEAASESTADFILRQIAT